MPVGVLLAVAIAACVVLLLAADRAVKAARKARRRREASGALTSVMPVIGDHEPRTVS